MSNWSFNFIYKAQYLLLVSQTDKSDLIKFILTLADSRNKLQMFLVIINLPNLNSPTFNSTCSFVCNSLYYILGLNELCNYTQGNDKDNGLNIFLYKHN